MNYETFIKHEYTYLNPNLSVGEHVFFMFFSDGSFATSTYADFSTDTLATELMFYVSNLANREYSNRGNLVAFQLYSLPTANNYQSVYFLTNRLDYCVTGGKYYYQGRHYDSIETDKVGDAIAHDNYYQGTTFDFVNYSYNYYYNVNDDSYSIYDLTNYKYENGFDYRSDTYSVRGENTSFYLHNIVSFSYSTDVQTSYFAYGSPFSEIANSEYSRGYNGGYNTGYVEGQRDGYAQGVASGGVDGNTHNALGYIQQAFGVVDNIMQLQVLPNITLGLVFSIPMTLVAIMVIFRIIKK